MKSAIRRNKQMRAFLAVAVILLILPLSSAVNRNSIRKPQENGIKNKGADKILSVPSTNLYADDKERKWTEGNRIKKKGAIEPLSVSSTYSNTSGRKGKSGYLNLRSLGEFHEHDVIDVKLLKDRITNSFEKKDIPSRGDFWYGESENATMNLLKMGTNDNGEDIVYGSIIEGDEIFHIQPDEFGFSRVTSTMWSDYRPEALPLGEELEYDFHLNGELTQDTQLIESDQNHTSVQIDIMVVWTKTAECKNSNVDNCDLNDFSTRNMMALISLAVDETNAAFLLSGIRVELRLVHAYRLPTYIEQGGESSIANALLDITDGIDDVHENRERYGADLVSMLVHDPYYCGLGWNGPEKHKGFSVSSWDCATGYFSFGHELAHNMGCHHDRGTKNLCQSNESTAYGYRDPEAEFRSIMAYNCRSSECDNNVGGGCPRVQRFSNTEFQFEGKPMGTSKNDNARQINAVSSFVASWYDPPSPVPTMPSPTAFPTSEATGPPSQLPTLSTPIPFPTSEATGPPSQLPTLSTPTPFPPSEATGPPSQLPTLRTPTRLSTSEATGPPSLLPTMPRAAITPTTPLAAEDDDPAKLKKALKSTAYNMINDIPLQIDELIELVATDAREQKAPSPTTPLLPLKPSTPPSSDPTTRPSIAPVTSLQIDDLTELFVAESTAPRTPSPTTQLPSSEPSAPPSSDPTNRPSIAPATPLEIDGLAELLVDEGHHQHL